MAIKNVASVSHIHVISFRCFLFCSSKPSKMVSTCFKLQRSHWSFGDSYIYMYIYIIIPNIHNHPKYLLVENVYAIASPLKSLGVHLFRWQKSGALSEKPLKVEPSGNRTGPPKGPSPLRPRSSRTCIRRGYFLPGRRSFFAGYWGSTKQSSQIRAMQMQKEVFRVFRRSLRWPTNNPAKNQKCITIHNQTFYWKFQEKKTINEPPKIHQPSTFEQNIWWIVTTRHSPSGPAEAAAGTLQAFCLRWSYGSANWPSQ